MRRAAAAIGKVGLLAAARHAAIAVLVATCGAADAADEVTSAPSPAERCLAPTDAGHARPVYPADMFEARRDGIVEARFTFTAPDRAPEVAIVQSSDGPFENAVRAYADGLRVPCLGAGDRPVSIAQRFDFVPNDGRKVAFTAPVDLAAANLKPRYACLVRPTENRPLYPPQLVRQGMEGTVVFRLRFTDPTQAPEMVVLDDGGSVLFVRAVRGYVEQFRLPCMGKEPVDLHFQYRYRLDGVGVNRVALRDQPLASFLRSVRQVPAGSVYFDTALMKCPFDVRLTFLQPWNRNRIDELEEDVPARHAFLDWLSGMQLDLGPRASNQVLGQSMVIHVPCVKIDL